VGGVRSRGGVGLVTGLLVDRFFGGPVAPADEVAGAAVVVDGGISELLLALTYVPDLGPNPNKAALYPQPFVSHVRIGHVVLTGMWVLTAVLVPVLVAGLAVFMRLFVDGQADPGRGQQCRRGAFVRDFGAPGFGGDVGSGRCAVGGVGAVAGTDPAELNVSTLGPYLLMFDVGGRRVRGVRVATRRSWWWDRAGFGRPVRVG